MRPMRPFDVYGWALYFSLMPKDILQVGPLQQDCALFFVSTDKIIDDVPGCRVALPFFQWREVMMLGNSEAGGAVHE